MKNIFLNRIMDLYNLLGDFPVEVKFGMAEWVSDSFVTNKKQAMDCGTACCAAGAGVLFLPSWKKHLRVINGLIFHKDDHHNGVDDSIYILSDFLGISVIRGSFIFVPAYYKTGVENITPRDVQKHIEILLNKEGYDIV